MNEIKSEVPQAYIEKFETVLKVGFREFFFHKKRNSFSKVFNAMCTDLKEIESIDKLYKSYRTDEFFLHLGLSKYSLRIRSLIEDSAYFIRLKEIYDSCCYSDMEWRELNKLLLQ